jgi:hypothetical protein
MNFFKRFIGQTATVKASRPPSGDNLELPSEFDGKMSYRDMFQTRTPEQLRTMCRALPIEALNLKRPGISAKMGRAITQVFAVSIYMATKEVPTEFGDIVFPRLVGKISDYDGSELHLELCDLVRDFAIYLEAGGRHQLAARVMNILKSSLFWHAWPQSDVCLFAALNNIALDTHLKQDYLVALKAAEQIPVSQVDNIVREAINNLRQKMEIYLCTMRTNVECLC